MRNNKGFSLVELIVVIAIMAILAAVAVAGFSMYIPKAQQATDKQMTSDIMYALELYYYSNPQQDMIASVAVGQNGAAVAEGDTFSAAAMQATFGDNWQNELKLQYDSWGNGAAVAQTVIAQFVAAVDENSALADIYTGAATPSYAEDVEDLFVVLKNTSQSIGNELDVSGAALVQSAAGTTITKINAEDFASNWANNAWSNDILMGDVDVSYGGNTTGFTEDELNVAIANAAVVKARNASIATYLKNNGYSSEVYDVFFNHNFEDSVVPKDVYVTMTAGDASTDALVAELEAAGVEDIDALSNAMSEYFSGGQAEIDGLAYYAMMSTVNTVENNNTNDETYWENMSDAVSVYASIAQGKATLEEMETMYESLGSVGENSILISMQVVDGELIFKVSPAAADSRQ